MFTYSATRTSAAVQFVHVDLLLGKATVSLPSMTDAALGATAGAAVEAAAGAAGAAWATTFASRAATASPATVNLKTRS